MTQSEEVTCQSQIGDLCQGPEEIQTSELRLVAFLLLCKDPLSELPCCLKAHLHGSPSHGAGDRSILRSTALILRGGAWTYRVTQIGMF